MKYCYYPDILGEYIQTEHIFDDDGFCIICGNYEESENKNMNQDECLIVLHHNSNAYKSPILISSKRIIKEDKKEHTITAKEVYYDYACKYLGITINNISFIPASTINGVEIYNDEEKIPEQYKNKLFDKIGF